MNRPALTRQRLGRFYAVGLIGAIVQLTVLGTLTYSFRLNLRISTVISVEVAVIHNYFWHDRWTWGLRRATDKSLARTLQRFCTFNLSAGLISVFMNVLVTAALVEIFGIPCLIANLLAIAAGSAATYLVGDSFVFKTAARQLGMQ